VTRAPDAPFSLTHAGPFYDALRACRIVDREGHLHWLRIVAIAWLPLMIATGFRTLAGEPIDLLLRDPSMHVRLLVSIPILLFAEHLLETRCRTCVQLVREEQLVEPEHLQPILERAERLRGSRLVETLLAVAALLGGQASLWGLAGPSGFVRGLQGEASVSFSVFWYTTISLPLVQFFVLRWLWRWLVWTYVLIKLSRAPLATNALHPDNLAGLKLLSGPVDAFAVFVAGNMCVASAAWIAQVREHGVELQAFAPRFIAFVLLATVLSCGPLLLFSGHIYRARYRDVGRYHAVAHEYVRAFRRKWVQAEGLERADLLGTPDLQSLNDLDGSFQVAEQTSALPIAKRPLLAVWIGALLPMVPLLFATMPASEIAKQVGRMLQLPAF
jgi:hypothetical protein